MHNAAPLIVFLAALSAAFTGCDRHETPAQQVELALRCDFLTVCDSMQHTPYGMVGDSWTDFFAGLPAQRDLHDWLEEEHGYRITSSIIAGQTAEVEVNMFRGFERVIRTAGPELRVMVVSLGGNDMLANTRQYQVDGVNVTTASRLARLEQNLRRMIAEGTVLKDELYGGAPLLWVIHGYDYINPEIENSCVRGALQAGMTVSASESFGVSMLEDMNARYRQLSETIPNFRYVDLRGTLGGPPKSSPSLKVDCIHPNDQGFRLLAARLALGIEAAAGAL